MFGEFPSVAKSALVVTTTCVLLTVLFAFSTKSTSDDPRGVPADLLTQSKQWFEMAKQDSDPTVSYQHAVLSQSFINVARHLASDDEIDRATGLNVRSYTKKVDELVQTLRSHIGRKRRK